MKKIWLSFILILSGILLLTGCAMLEGLIPAEELVDIIKPPMTVDVMLQENEGIVISSANPVSVKPGEAVSFSVEIRDGYKLEGLGQGAVYENGVVTLADVKFPTTIEVETRVLNDLTVKVNNNSWQGEIIANVDMDSTIREDTEVTLKVTPAKGLIFLGYSIGATQANGGTIVSAATEYTFTLTENTTLYTNYYNVGSGRLVMYDGNGAKEGTQYYVFPDNLPYSCPNAMANKGQFTREGYVLYGYNTKADGSGTYYGPGWSVILPEDSSVPMTLYAQWMPVTEQEAFTYTVANNQVTITHYKGDHETVVIPETIDGMPVVKIAAHAFLNCKFDTVYLSCNLQTVEDGAFLGCKQLTTVYLCDQVKKISDAGFSNCLNFSKLYMLAVMDPRYSYSGSNNGTYKSKYQRLITAEGKKIIFHGGSNVSYGIDTEVMAKELNGEYSPVNFGCNQGTSAVFFASVAAAHMNEGDILVLCPEIKDYQYGQNDINTTTWQIFEGAYNAFADVDIRNFTKVLTSFASFNNNRYSATVRTYEGYHKSVNGYGDYILYHEKPLSAMADSLAKWKSGSSLLNMDVSLLSKKYNDNMVKAIDLVKSVGGKVYYSFAVTCGTGLTAESRTVARQMEYKNAVAKAFPNATVISNPGTFILEDKWFYNSIYHVTSSGAEHRTKLLAKDILAQFAKEK